MDFSTYHCVIQPLVLGFSFFSLPVHTGRLCSTRPRINHPLVVFPIFFDRSLIYNVLSPKNSFGPPIYRPIQNIQIRDPNSMFVIRECYAPLRGQTIGEHAIIFRWNFHFFACFMHWISFRNPFRIWQKNLNFHFHNSSFKKISGFFTSSEVKFMFSTFLHQTKLLL